MESSLAVYDTACFEVLVRTGMIDALYDNVTCGTGPISVHSLGSAYDIDPGKLMPILRHLATLGWLHEPHEGMFSLTRPALSLRQGENGRKWAM
jgi:hypothetical protein